MGEAWSGWRPPPGPPPGHSTRVVVAWAVGALVGGVVIGALLTIAAVGVLGFTGALDPPSITRGEGGDIASDELRAGACADGVLDGSRTSLTPVPCSQDHLFEVYAGLDAPPEVGRRYPGAGDLAEFAHGLCVLAFRERVHQSYETSLYDFQIVVPNVAGWRDGEREVSCVLLDPAGEVLPPG